MSFLTTSVLAIVATMLAATAFSQDKPVFEVNRLTEHLYELTTDGGGYTVKVIASIGSDGILLVDAGQKQTGEALKAQIQSLGNGTPRIIISTHSHVEHTAGNIAFGPDPLIIGHKNVGPRLTSGSYLFDEFPEWSLPRLTFADSMSLRFNGEEIKLIAFPGAHDNSDIIVWFTGSGIVCVGALSNGFHFPSVDGVTGDVLKYPKIVGQVIDLLPDDVKIIPGHGEDCTMDDFRAFHKMLVQTRKIVEEGLAAGKDLAALQEEDVLKDWTSFEGSYVDRNQWLKYLVEALQEIDSGKPPLKKIWEPMYYAYAEKGADAAIALYRQLKTNQADEYMFREVDPVIIGFKLYDNKKLTDAIKFFDLAVAEYPDGEYAWLSYNNIGKAYRELGEKELAVKNYKKSLELNPENTRAAEALKELEGE